MLIRMYYPLHQNKHLHLLLPPLLYPQRQRPLPFHRLLRFHHHSLLWFRSTVCLQTRASRCPGHTPSIWMTSRRTLRARNVTVYLLSLSLHPIPSAWSNHSPCCPANPHPEDFLQSCRIRRARTACELHLQTCQTCPGIFQRSLRESASGAGSTRNTVMAETRLPPCRHGHTAD